MIVIYEDYEDRMFEFYLSNIKSIFKTKNIPIEYYNEGKEKGLNYLRKGRNSKMYTGVFQYCKDGDTLYIPRLLNPEFLLSHIEYYKPKFKIVFMTYGIVDQHMSPAKKLVYQKLNDYGCIHIIQSVGGNIVYPDGHYDTYAYESSKKVFNVLCMGSMFYGKGFDILLECISREYHNFKAAGIHFIFIGDPKRANYNIDLDMFKKDIITFIDRDYTGEEINYFTRGADLIVAPYRKVYEHNSSHILLDAVNYNKLVLFPDIQPFNTVIKQFNLGQVFEVENIKSLAEKIFDLHRRKEEYISKYQGKEYLDTMNKRTNWSVLSEIIGGN